MVSDRKSGQAHARMHTHTQKTTGNIHKSIQGEQMLYDNVLGVFIVLKIVFLNRNMSMLSVADELVNVLTKIIVHKYSKKFKCNHKFQKKRRG